MNKLIRICMATLMMATNLAWAQAIEETIEAANVEVVFVEGNDRGRLIVRDPECVDSCNPVIFVVERELPIYLNTGERIPMQKFIDMKRGVADVQYEIATDKLLNVFLQ